MRTITILWFTLVALGLSLSAAAVAEERANPQQRTRIMTLVRQLGSPSFETRNQAAQELVEMGDAASPILRELLADENAKLSIEQKQHIDKILTGGFIGLLETRSGLDEVTIDLLRMVRSGSVDNDNKWEIFRQIQAITQTAGVSDEAIALVIRSITPQLPRDEDWSKSVLEEHSAMRVFNDLPKAENAGQHTAAAIGDWIQRWYIPCRLYPSKQQHSFSGGQADDAVRAFLLKDMLDAAGYAMFMDAYCKKIGSGREIDDHNELGMDQRAIIGLAFSRHADSRRIGQLAQALITRHLVERSTSHWNSPIEGLTYLAASPKLTETQARTIIDTLLSADYEGRLRQDDLHAVMAILTQHTLLTAEEICRMDFGEIATLNRGNRIVRLWRDWWREHRNEPLWPRTESKRYRYIQVRITVGPEPRIETTMDAIVNVGREAQVVHNANDPAQSWWIQIVPQSYQLFSEYMLVMGSAFKDAVHVRYYHFSQGGFSGGDRVLIPGQAEHSGTIRSNNIQSISATLLLDPARNDSPSEQQLQDPGFWAERMLRSKVDYYEQMLEADIDEALRSQFLQYRGLSSLAESYPVELFAEPMRELADGDEDRLAVVGWLALARWDREIDMDRLRGLFNSDDAQVVIMAAEAMAQKGCTEPVEALTRELAGETPRSFAYETLLSLSTRNRYEPQVRADLAAQIIRQLLPKREDPENPPLRLVILTKQWSARDFGYRLGADAEHNNAALAKYHAWSEHPAPPSGDDEAVESSEATQSLQPDLIYP